NHTTGSPLVSIVDDRVIIDRSAKPGWPKRIGPLTHSPIAADLDDDGRAEIVALTHFGELYVYKIDGTQIVYRKALPFSGESTYAAPAIGDIDGDGRPDIVWCSDLQLFVHSASGDLLPGFPIPVPAGVEFRVTPTLADVTGDGKLDIII